MRRYLKAKHPTINRSFIDIVQKAFLEDEELDYTHIQPVNTVPPFIIPPVELPPLKVPIKPIIPFTTDQTNEDAVANPKPSS